MNWVSIATVQDKHNAPFAQKDSSVRTLHQNLQHARRVFIVPRVMQHVQYALRGMSVQMGHHRPCVLRDSMHPSVPQHARLVLQAINVLVKECPLPRVAQQGSTQTRPCRWDVTLVRLVGSALMVIVLCHVQLATSVNLESLTAQPANQDITAVLAHQCVCHVLQENSVWTLLLIQ